MTNFNLKYNCNVHIRFICNLTHPMATFLENHIIEQVKMLWLLLAYSIILNLECTLKKKKNLYKIILS